MTNFLMVSFNAVNQHFDQVKATLNKVVNNLITATLKTTSVFSSSCRSNSSTILPIYDCKESRLIGIPID